MIFDFLFRKDETHPLCEKCPDPKRLRHLRRIIDLQKEAWRYYKIIDNIPYYKIRNDYKSLIMPLFSLSLSEGIFYRAEEERVKFVAQLRDLINRLVDMADKFEDLTAGNGKEQKDGTNRNFRME